MTIDLSAVEAIDVHVHAEVGRAGEDGLRPEWVILEYWPPACLREETRIAPERLGWRDGLLLERYVPSPEDLRRQWWPGRFLPAYTHRHALLSHLAPELDPSNWEQLDARGWRAPPEPRDAACAGAAGMRTSDAITAATRARMSGTPRRRASGPWSMSTPLLETSTILRAHGPCDRPRGDHCDEAAAPWGWGGAGIARSTRLTRASNGPKRRTEGSVSPPR